MSIAMEKSQIMLVIYCTSHVLALFDDPYAHVKVLQAQ